MERAQSYSRTLAIPFIAAAWLALVLSPQNAFASELTVAERILDLLSEGEVETAYKLALDKEPELEGVIDFDFALGVSARKSKDWDRALFAFERILLTHPESVNARFAIAMTYLELNNYEAAKHELTLLAARQLGEPFDTRVARYLELVDRKIQHQQQRWESFVEMGLGSDSNPNSGLDEEFITLPTLGQITLFDSSRAFHSSFNHFQAATSYIRPFNKNSTWSVTGAVQHSRFSEDTALDRTHASLSGRFQKEQGDFNWYVMAFYRPIWLDGDDYLSVTGVSGGVETSFSSSARIGAELTLSDEHHKTVSNRDKTVYMAAVWAEKRMASMSHRLSLIYSLDDGDAKVNDLASRELYGVNYLWQWVLSPSWHSALRVDYLAANYDEINPIFAQERSDIFTRISWQVQYDLSTRWRVFSKLSYLHNDSHLKLYNYYRSSAMVGVRYEF